MAAYTARIVFTGVCAYIPNRPWTIGSPDFMTVVLPEGRDGQACEEFKTEVDVHTAYAALPVAVLDGKLMAYRIETLLGRVEFELSQRDQAKNPFSTKAPSIFGPGAYPEKDGPGTNLGWLPYLNRLLPDHSKPLERCTQLPVLTQTAAQVRVSHGLVQTHYSGNMEWPRRYWAFESPGQGRRLSRAFANQVEVVFSLLDPLTLVIKDRHGAERKRIELLPEVDLTRLELVVGNLCDYLKENPAEILQGTTLGDMYWLRMKENSKTEFVRVDVDIPVEPAPGVPDKDLRLLYCLSQQRGKLLEDYKYAKHVPTLIFDKEFDNSRREITPTATRTANCYGAILNP